MNGKIVIVIDRLVFAFLLVPFIFIGLTSGLFVIAIIMTITAAIRFLIQYLIRDKVTTFGRTMPFLNLNIHSYEIILFSFGISLALAIGEGELVAFLRVSVIVLIFYFISAFFLFRYEFSDSTEEDFN